MNLVFYSMILLTSSLALAAPKEAGKSEKAAKSEKTSKSSKVFILLDDGCEHEVAHCESKPGLPKKRLMRKSEYKAVSSYQGSFQLAAEEDNEAGVSLWEHYFSNSKDCEAAREKLGCSEQ